ncbi:nuclear transport factor 2 family protein [Nocardia sp. BMG111209]|uniref:nuclear transport factor 2 family protein n=1 Tax=Nocardia sp. BMG111209 TaxID=1160137 RepID=UPI00036D9245|nr:nuclear transport factor 2 family protein [Nocardia sp. BMG111209]
MHRPIDIVRRAYTAIALGDTATLTALTHPDIRIHQSAELPYGGDYAGITGLHEYLTNSHAILDSTIDPGELFTTGDLVLQAGYHLGTTRSTGTPFDVPEIHIWRIRHGRIVELSVYLDDTALLAALTT